MHFIGVGLRLSQAADSAEVSYAVASMTISIDAKCNYVLVFIRSRSTWGPLSQGVNVCMNESAGLIHAHINTYVYTIVTSARAFPEASIHTHTLAPCAQWSVLRIYTRAVLCYLMFMLLH